MVFDFFAHKEVSSFYVLDPRVMLWVCGEHVFTRGVHNLFFYLYILSLHLYFLTDFDAAHQPRSLYITIFLPLSANANKHLEFY